MYTVFFFALLRFEFGIAWRSVSFYSLFVILGVYMQAFKLFRRCRFNENEYIHVVLNVISAKYVLRHGLNEQYG